jgi:hypothetical protein
MKPATLPAKVSLGTGILVLTIGLIVGGIAARSTLDQQHRLASALRGTVIALGNDCERHPRASRCAERTLVRVRDTMGITHEILEAAGSTSSNYHPDDSVLIVRPVGQQERIESSSIFAQWVTFAIFGGLGLLLSGAGLIVAGAALRRWAERRWLAIRGVRVIAGSLQVGRIIGSDNLPSRRAYQILAQWRNPADGLVHCFGSDPILIDPQPSLTGRSGIEVLIDPDRPDRYWMDTSFLPPVPSLFNRR